MGFSRETEPRVCVCVVYVCVCVHIQARNLRRAKISILKAEKKKKKMVSQSPGRGILSSLCEVSPSYLFWPLTRWVRALGRAICFAQSTDSRVNLNQNRCHGHIQK